MNRPDGGAAGSGSAVRTLICVVLYESERFIEEVLDRIPGEILAAPGNFLLVVDDSSVDSSAERASAWMARNHCRGSVLRNVANLGYGGNQKIGYRFAIEAGFDLVILLHGDGQYAPELLPRFVEVFARTGADVVLGSRMSEPRAALAGGMPLYKYVGNRLLTGFQNFLCGRSLSEYHTGYRAYAVRFLRTIPFELDSNRFHFDTEILLQAFSVGARIEEFAIPTHYGEEVSRVDGLAYAWNVVKATGRHRLQQVGILTSLKYRTRGNARYASKTGLAYSSHRAAVQLVDASGPSAVLDVGCGPGHVAAALRARGHRVDGVDVEVPDAGPFERTFVADLDAEFPPLDAWSYDWILLLDVLEHLSEPEQLLLRLRHSGPAESGGAAPRLLVTTPNVAFWSMRLGLLLGRFNYGDRGILDITHRRLFTFASLLRALEETGYEIERVRGVAPPFEAVLPGRVGRFLGAVAGVFAALWRRLFAFQILVVCRPKPGTTALLRAARRIYPGEAGESGGTGRRQAPQEPAGAEEAAEPSPTGA